MAGLKQLIQEVHRRSLWQVLLIYIAASWAVLEAADVMVSRLALPEWVYGAAIVLLLVGLPIVLATAFVQEGVTPSRPEPPGVADDAAKTVTQAHEATGTRRLFTWRNAISGGVLALALWGVIATGWYVVYGGAAAESSDERKSIAVIPFENLSGGEENEAFTNGVHDVVLTHLYKIADLKPTSRTSVMEYRDTGKNIRQIAEELGVATVLEGTVQRVGNRVLVNVQLIDAERDEQIWAETYDRELTLENIFAIQAEIARHIATALRAEITAEEDELLVGLPTDNMEAYDLYLRGNEWLSRGFIDEKNHRIAAEMYQRAVELDPEFVEAYAGLSRAHSALYFLHGVRNAESLELAESAAKMAVQLAPRSAAAQLALGYYYYTGFQDYEGALQRFVAAREIEPNNSILHTWLGVAQRRLGDFDGAVISLQQALELDPRSSFIAHTLGATYRRMRQFSEAEHYYRLAISLSPDQSYLYGALADIYLSWKGDLDLARQALSEASGKVDPDDLVRSMATSAYAGGIRILGGEYSDRLRTVTGALLGKGRSFELDNPQLARVYYDSARVVLEARSQAPSFHPVIRVHLAIAYAGMGLHAEALREGEMAARLLPITKDGMAGPHVAWHLAQIYLAVGDHDAAIDLLELLLSKPNQISVWFLRLDPLWDPLRDHPRFEALLEKYE